MQRVKGKKKPLHGTVMLGDTAYFSEDNLQAAKQYGIETIIPDEQYRNRDNKLKAGERREGKERFDARYFKYVKRGNYYVCPNGKKLAYRGKTKLNRNEGHKYRKIYSRRMQIVEPVFADITYCKGITRFTLRGQKKVNVQWQLYCVVHNIGKCSMAKKRKRNVA